VIEKMDLADPALIRFEGRYYLYPTNEAGGTLGFDVYLSDDLVHWTQGLLRSGDVTVVACRRRIHGCAPAP
jgi:hypothetical protein